MEEKYREAYEDMGAILHVMAAVRKDSQAFMDTLSADMHIHPGVDAGQTSLQVGGPLCSQSIMRRTIELSDNLTA